MLPPTSLGLATRITKVVRAQHNFLANPTPKEIST